MSVQDGQKVNAATVNAAFVSKTVNSTVAAVIALNDTVDANSGAEILNAQRAINETFDAVGMSGIGDAARKTYSSSNVVATGDSHKVAIGKLDSAVAGKLTGAGTVTDNALPRFDGTTGAQLQGSSVIVDDSNNITGVNNLTVTGTLTVNGTTTTVNSATLDVTDKNITVNKGGNDAASEGSGLTVDRTSTKGSLIYVAAAASKFKIGALAAEVEVADISSAQVITNKDINGGTASNTSRITVPKASKATLDGLTRKQGTVVYASDTDKIYKDNGSALVEIGAGSGSGVGGINYITNYDAEIDTTGWATYADGSVTIPVDGTGGSPTLTFTRTTSTPLRGTGSFLITKDAANRQGNGASYDFTIDSADKAKVLSISFDYAVASGTYADNDLAVFIYDVTNASLIQPAGSGILGVGANAKYTSTFQTNSNSTSYRLIIHCASTSTSAYTVKLDNVIVGPQSLQYGAVATDWVAYTPTFSAGFGTVTGIAMSWRRVGVNMEITGRFSAGTVAASSATVSLPSGYSINNTLGNLIVGRWVNNISTGTTIKGGVVNAIVTNSTTVLYFTADDYTTAANAGTTVNGNVAASTGQSTAFNASIPIQGWSSNVLMSSDADTRVVAFSASTAAAVTSLTSSFSDIKFTTVAFDSHGAYTAASGTYTVPVPGFYLVTAAVEFTGTTAANADEGIRLVAFGGSFAGQYNLAPTNSAACVYSAAAGVYCAAGTAIKVQAATGRTSPSFSVTASVSNFTVTRMSGPAAIAATESVNCKYTNSAGTSISNSGSDVNVPFATKVFDSHNAWNGTQFVVPVSGKYRISGNVEFASSAYSAGDQVILSAYKTAVSVSAGPRVTATAATFSAGVMVTTTVDCVAGDTLELRVANARTAGATLLRAVTLTNHVEVERIGN